MNKIAVFGFACIVIVTMISMLIWTFYPKEAAPSSIKNAATLEMGDETEMQVAGGDPENLGKNDEELTAGQEIQPVAVPGDSLIQTNSMTPPRIDPPISSRDQTDKDVPNPLFVNSKDLTHPICKVHDDGAWAMCHNAPFKRWTQMSTTTEDTLAACTKHYVHVTCPPRV